MEPASFSAVRFGATEIQVQSMTARTQVDTTRTRILVIDDDPSTLQLVHTVLEVHGYEALTASSAEHALAILSATPDVLIVISDINMPGMDGIMFLERIASRVPAQATPGVIFLTAHPRMDFAVAALRLGALDFLTKPVRPQELLQAVKGAVDRVRHNLAVAQPPAQMLNLAQQAETLAAALKGWAYLQPQKAAETTAPAPRKPPGDNARGLALVGMGQVRRLRRSYPPLGELDDIAWDLLLELARAEKSGQRLSVSALCVSIEHVSSTTALRRVQELVKAGHIIRVADPADARRDFVVLGPSTQATLDQYLERVAQELAAVAHGA
jgi:CheY-like chemotaxis protein/DNA-binding MarR family transcriptional regulator